jgi:hypothetical protein
VPRGPFDPAQVTVAAVIRTVCIGLPIPFHHWEARSMTLTPNPIAWVLLVMCLGLAPLGAAVAGLDGCTIVEEG